jgi:type VI secretion system secreted protein Hcp
MVTPAYMPITGTQQGLIIAGVFTADSVGNICQESHENQVMVQRFSHAVIIPRDPQSDQPTGQRVHQPVVITQVFDKASPRLLTALTCGERMIEIALHWGRTSAAGTQERYDTTQRGDVHPPTAKSPSPSKSPLLRVPMTGELRARAKSG